MVEVGKDILEKFGTFHNAIDALVKPVSTHKFWRYCQNWEQEYKGKKCSTSRRYET
jgi:hypothetical protein